MFLGTSEAFSVYSKTVHLRQIVLLTGSFQLEVDALENFNKLPDFDEIKDEII